MPWWGWLIVAGGTLAGAAAGAAAVALYIASGFRRNM